MTVLAITPSEDQASPGDLHARVIDGKIMVPASVTGRLAREGLRTADDLLAYMQAFPSAVAELLQWRSEDVMRATKALQRQLGRPALPRQPGGRTPRNPPLGAFDPDDLPS